MLSYFGNLVAFCLIFLKNFKVFILLSMVIKEKILKIEMREIEFLLDLEFVLCLLKLMNC